MIDSDILRQVRTVVVHENSHGSPCPDGTASAILLADAMPWAKIHFAAHGHSSLEALTAEPNMLFCDITPSPDRAYEFAASGAIVLDHHEKHKATVELFENRGIYADEKGVSGAMLAFTEVWCRLPHSETARANAEKFARLAGVRDTWWQEHPDWEASCAQAEALRFWPWDEWPQSPFFGNDDVFADMMRIGEVMLQKNRAKNADVAKNVYFVTSMRGTRIAVMPTTETSDVADLVDSDVLVGFKYRHDVASQKVLLILSMRSRKKYDVGALAKVVGGGGHAFAAGAQVAPRGTPYEQIVSVFDEYERSTR